MDVKILRSKRNNFSIIYFAYLKKFVKINKDFLSQFKYCRM